MNCPKCPARTKYAIGIYSFLVFIIVLIPILIRFVLRNLHPSLAHALLVLPPLHIQLVKEHQQVFLLLLDFLTLTQRALQLRLEGRDSALQSIFL